VVTRTLSPTLTAPPFWLNVGALACVVRDPAEIVKI